jgi:hypothetical protein
MANTSGRKAMLLRDGLTENYLASIWATMLVGPTLGSSPPAVAQQQQLPQQKQCDAVGRPPRTGEILQRHGTGPHRVIIENGGSAEPVVKMRDDHHRTALAVYVGPYGTAQVDHFPSGRFRPEFATGQDWSRACGVFLSGMRVQRFPTFNDFQTHKAGRGGSPPIRPATSSPPRRTGTSSRRPIPSGTSPPIRLTFPLFRPAERKKDKTLSLTCAPARGVSGHAGRDLESTGKVVSPEGRPSQLEQTIAAMAFVRAASSTK